MRIAIIRLLFLSILFLSACTADISSPTAIQDEGNLPYPITTADILPTGTPPPYPVENLETAIAAAVVSTPFVLPTAGLDTGVVTGFLVSSETKQPLQYQTMYLGQKIFLTPAPGYTIGIQEKSSPHSMGDVNGQFAIANVPPGSYVLVVWTPFSSSFVIDPKTGVEIDVVVEAGKIVDLGTVEAPPPQ